MKIQILLKIKMIVVIGAGNFKNNLNGEKLNYNNK